MGKLCAAISCLWLMVAAVMAQTTPTVQLNDRLLPQWLTGIIAVCAFIFLAFVTFLAKKAWCEDPNRKRNAESVRENEFIMTNGNAYATTLDEVRSKDDMNAYNNLVIQVTDDKVTAM